jgi:hypothetical protein
MRLKSSRAMRCRYKARRRRLFSTLWIKMINQPERHVVALLKTYGVCVRSAA